MCKIELETLQDLVNYDSDQGCEVLQGLVTLRGVTHGDHTPRSSQVTDNPVLKGLTGKN